MDRRLLLQSIWLIGTLIALLTVVSYHPPRIAAQTHPGTIAYVRPNDATGDEIWLIEPDGSNERQIWSTGKADPFGVTEISDLDWRADGGELAFASSHESACSIYDSDIYTIWPDGSGYRRLTNAPACANLEGYAKGAVTVTVQNSTTRGPFFVYVQGAPGVQQVNVPQGGSATVTFPDVADFGDTVQVAVVIMGLERWIAPIAAADVVPGQTVHAGTLQVTGAGFRNYGAYVPSWHPDGLRLGFIQGDCAAMWQLSALPAEGQLGELLLRAENVFPCVLDWGPPPALTNQLLYYSYLGGGIYRVSEGSTTAGTQLVPTEGHELVLDLQWLPDGSGFVFTKTGDFLSNANVYHYAFATGVVTPLTDFTDTFARDISVSADGQFIVFERATAQDSPSADLWMMNQDGSAMELLVPNGIRPSWSQQALQVPEKVYLPLVQH